MRIVSEQSRDELLRRQGMEDVGHALRELAANLMRVVRGAGAAQRLPGQAVALVQAFETFESAAGCLPAPDLLSDLLKITLPDELLGKYSPNDQARVHAEAAIVGGCLQIAASRLVGQLTQERAGESEMYQGIRDLAEVTGAERKARLAAARADHAPRDTVKAKRRSKVKPRSSGPKK